MPRWIGPLLLELVAGLFRRLWTLLALALAWTSCASAWVWRHTAAENSHGLGLDQAELGA